MRKTYCILLFLVFFSVLSIAQTAYRSKANPYYWKNRKPHAAYWQQDVHYIIEAKIDEKTDIISAKQRLIYYNNSPDTLTQVYFHLYRNAFVKGGYMQDIYNIPPGNYQKEGLGTIIESLNVNHTPVEPVIDNTIMYFDLPSCLPPNDSVVFDIVFKTYFDINARWGRMKVFESWGEKQYNGAHWYPRICVYDMKFGWNTDQHLGHEFYGDFGTYDVSLDFANHYIVEATGTLTNKAQVLPDSLMQKLDLRNFKDKTLGSAPSIIIPYDSTVRKTWKWHAINVHDFAFIANPHFRIGHAKYKEIDCYAFAQESNAAEWLDAAELTADIIALLSKEIGDYAYPKMTTGDCRAGMEYPMLTMNSGRSPSYAYIFTHEMAHNWFFAMVATNETYRPALDEGFTQYYTVVGLEELAKSKEVRAPDNRSKLLKLLQKENFYSFRYDYAYYRYLNHAINTEGRSLNTHADMFNSMEIYGEDHRQAYYKSATMLFNLRYILGDSLFNLGMQSYFEQWKMAHPYLNDMRSSFIHATNTDLNWFFDQWLNTTKTIDYSVQNVKKIAGEKTSYEITLKRKGEMQMPLDILITDKSGKTYAYYIPNTYFVKPNSGTVLPKWYGWDYFYPEYRFTVTLDDKIDKVEIDPQQLMADVNLLDNSNKLPLSLSFDAKISKRPDWEHYELKWRPAIWWNALDGIKAGINLKGDYMEKYANFSFRFYVNTGMFQGKTHELPAMDDFDVEKEQQTVSFMYRFSNPVHKQWKGLEWNLHGYHNAGLDKYGIGLNYLSKNKKHKFKASFQTMYRENLSDYYYVLFADGWTYNPKPDSVLYNNSFRFNYTFFLNNNHKQKQSLSLNFKSSGPGDSYSYAASSLEHKYEKDFGFIVWKNRIFAQHSIGRSMPKESSLFFAGANPEEMMNNPFLEAVGYIPLNYTVHGISTNHFHYGGGLNMRGYSGYLLAHENPDSSFCLPYFGHSGIAWNNEIYFDRFFPFKPKFVSDYLRLNTYFFSDFGIISTNKLDEKASFSKLRIDAGIGCSLTIKSWGSFDELKDFSVRFDMPLFLNRPPAVEDYFQWRWVLGIAKAF
jgi:aminopeptidase N